MEVFRGTRSVCLHDDIPLWYGVGTDYYNVPYTGLSFLTVNYL